MNDLYAELDFAADADQTIYDLNGIVEKDPEELTEKLEVFCEKVQEGWDDEEFNTTHRVWVEYSESDHYILIAVKRIESVPVTRIGWSSIPDLKKFIENEDE